MNWAVRFRQTARTSDSVETSGNTERRPTGAGKKRFSGFDFFLPNRSLKLHRNVVDTVVVVDVGAVFVVGYGVDVTLVLL